MNEINIKPYTESRLVRNGNEFDFQYAPHLALFDTKEVRALMVPTLGSALFDPLSLDLWAEVKEGDFINVKVDLNECKEIWEAWDPPEEYVIADGTYRVEVKLVIEEATGHSMVIGKIV